MRVWTRDWLLMTAEDVHSRSRLMMILLVGDNSICIASYMCLCVCVCVLAVFVFVTFRGTG